MKMAIGRTELKLRWADTRHTMTTSPSIYLYLTRPEWAAAWTDGGSVPINPASLYRRDFDSGRDIALLKQVLDRQIGIASMSAPVTYTHAQHRDHFTKVRPPMAG